MNKSELKSQNAITLVALIITIIILLILAIVSIRLVMNGGIIDRAERGTQAYSEAEIQEQIKLAYSEWQTAQWTSDAGDAATFVQTRLRTALNDNGLTVTGSNGAFTVTLTGGKQYSYKSSTGKAAKVKNVDEYPTVTATTNNNAVEENSKYVSDNKTAIIPAGYAISNESTEQSIDNGLVIKKDGNEWVWIPVSSADLALMYTEDSTGWTLSGTSGNDAVVTKYKSNSRTDIKSDLTRSNPGTGDYREPDTIIGEIPSYMGGGGTDNVEANWTAAGFSSFNNMATSLRYDYKNMIDSVRKYGGFYVGRYELSNAGTQKNQTVLTNTNWYNLYAACKASTLGASSVETRMIWGCQWDQICKFISTSGDQVSLTDSRSYGNYQDSTGNAAVVVDNTNKYGSKQVTGYSEYWKANNIYDIAGNCYEWTQEANGTSFRAYRGGTYGRSGSDYPVTGRSGSGPTSNDGSSSRPTLYIK